MQVGYQVQFFGFGIFSTLFAVYAATGELRRHQRIGQLVLIASLVLNFVYTSFVFYESYITASTLSTPSLRVSPYETDGSSRSAVLTPASSRSLSRSRIVRSPEWRCCVECFANANRLNHRLD